MPRHPADLASTHWLAGGRDAYGISESDVGETDLRVTPSPVLTIDGKQQVIDMGTHWMLHLMPLSRMSGRGGKLSFRSFSTTRFGLGNDTAFLVSEKSCLLIPTATWSRAMRQHCIACLTSSATQHRISSDRPFSGPWLCRPRASVRPAHLPAPTQMNSATIQYRGKVNRPIERLMSF